MTARQHISRKTELAAALIQIANNDEFYQHSKQLTADQVISLFQRDHCPIRKEDGGPDAPWNLTWRFIGEHRRKTATIDKPQSAKGKRLRDSRAEHEARMELDSPRQRSRPQGRVRSRGFDKTKTRKFSGEVVLRRRATVD